MIKHILWLSLVMLVSLSFAGPKPDSLSKEERGSQHMNPAKFLKEEIGFSDDQLKKLEIIRLDADKQMEMVRHDMEMEKLAIKDMALKGTLTKAKLKESIKKAEEARTKIHACRFQAALSSVDIFTEDQIRKLAEKKMLGRFFEMKEDGGRDGMRWGKKDHPDHVE